MEIAYIKDITREQIHNFHQDFPYLIWEKNIKYNNTYNSYETSKLGEK